MIWKYLFLAAVAVSVTLSSCLLPKNAAIRKWCKPVSSVTDSTRNDTTSHTSRSSEINDTKIITPETNLETEFNPCDSLGRANKDLLIKLKGGAGSLEITPTKNGNIKINCRCDSTVDRLRTELIQKDSMISVLQVDKSKEVVTVTAPEESSKNRYLIALAVLVILSAVVDLVWIIKNFPWRRSK